MFAFAGLSFRPGPHDILLVSMPLMVYALGMAGAAHIVRLYRATVAQQGLEGAPSAHCVSRWCLAVWRSSTVVMGILALTANRLVPVREFGLTGAAGCLIARAARLSCAFRLAAVAAAIRIPATYRRPSADSCRYVRMHCGAGLPTGWSTTAG